MNILHFQNFVDTLMACEEKFFETPLADAARDLRKQEERLREEFQAQIDELKAQQQAPLAKKDKLHIKVQPL